MAAITMYGDCQEVAEGPYLLRVSRMRADMDPFRHDIWGQGPVRRADVERAIAERRFALTPNEPWCGRHAPEYEGRPMDYDVERIAYLAVNPAADPICFEVTSHWGDAQLLDGGHRTGAAVFRKDLWILAGFGGVVDAFHARFPEALRQPKQPSRVYGRPDAQADAYGAGIPDR